MQRLAVELAADPQPVGRRRNHLTAGGRTVRLGFGHGQTANQRGIKGFPKPTTETFYLEVPGPVDRQDLIVAVVGETELLFDGPEFLRLAGGFTGARYLPNFFRDTRDGRYWARIAGLDVNYPLDSFVSAWPSGTATNGASTTGHDSDATASEKPDDQFINFKPGNSGDYRVHVDGRALVKSRSHEKLTADFGLWAADLGFRPSTVEYPRDLVLRKDARIILVEAKMLYRGNATQAVRAAIGQLLTYRYLLHSGEPIELCALFSETVGDEFVRLLHSLSIAVVWREVGGGWCMSSRAEGLGLLSR